MKRPSLDDLYTAAEWLKFNEGDGGESEACTRVAAWLEAYVLNSQIRTSARELGCSVERLRARMSEKKTTV